MKDVSVTLGKIEERFGEKLNSLNDKITHLSAERVEKSEELETAEGQKEKIINDLMDRAKLNEQEKKEYISKLNEQDDEIAMLRKQLQCIEMRYHKMQTSNGIGRGLERFFDESDLQIMKHHSVEEWPDQIKAICRRLNLIDDADIITAKGRAFFRTLL